MNRKITLILVGLPLLVSSCLKDNSDTVLLPTGDLSVIVIPEQIRETLGEGMPLYEGTTPPDISGQYLCRPMTLVSSSISYDEIGKIYAPQYEYYAGHSTGHIRTYYCEQGSGHSTNGDTQLQIIGTGNQFTAYFVSEEWSDRDDDGIDESWTKQSTLISGILTDEGIEDYHYAFVLLDKIDPLERIINVGEWRVFEDGDGLAERYEWYSGKTPRRNINKEDVLPTCMEK